MVALQILVLSAQVRILVPQPKKTALSPSFSVEIPIIPLHPQGTGGRIPPHGSAVPLRSGFHPSEYLILPLPVSLGSNKESNLFSGGNPKFGGPILIFYIIDNQYVTF